MKLKNVYLKYDKSITSDVFDKIVNSLRDSGIRKSSTSVDDYNSFIKHGFIKTYPTKDWQCVTKSCLDDQVQITVKDILGETDSWCVRVTEENKDVVKSWMNEKKCYSVGAYYGIDKCGEKKAHVENRVLDTLLTTEEFYKKIGHEVGFKVGDWVTFIPDEARKCNTFTAGAWDKPHVLKIDRIRRDSLEFDASLVIDTVMGCSNHSKCFRHATPEEIAKAKGDTDQPTTDNMIAGEIYFVEYVSRNGFISLSDGNDNVRSYIDVGSKSFHKGGNCHGRTNIRKPTPHESKWLNVCIKHNQSIQESELDNYNDKTFDITPATVADINAELEGERDIEYMKEAEKFINEHSKPRVTLLRKKKLTISIDNEVQIKIKKR